MNQKAAELECDLVFERERLLAISGLLKGTVVEIETHVRGRSMGRTLPNGSQVRIRLGPIRGLIPGQVVAYLASDRLVAHRLVKEAKRQNTQYAITRGDATLCCDVPVPTRSVIGIVTELRDGDSWRAVGPSVTRSYSSALLASALTGIVVTSLQLNPGLSRWIATRIVAIRWALIKSVDLLKRFTRAVFTTRTQF